MLVGSFPPLSSINDFKEFDGSPEKLHNFLTSVEGSMVVYNIPFSQGGFVAGNVDDRWVYVSVIVHTAYPLESRANHDYGRRYLILLTERFYWIC